MTLPVAILAGGLATRLGSLAAATPKALMEVSGEPFAFHQLRLLAKNGVSQVVFCVGHLGQQIEASVGDEMFDVKIAYVEDGPALLGTGGALKRAIPLLGTAFLVLYGDSYLECDYVAVMKAFQDNSKAGLMTVFRNDGQWARSNVCYEAGTIIDYDKHADGPSYRHVDYGLGAFRANVFDHYPAGVPFDLSVVYRDLISKRELAAFEVHNRFFEVGTPSGIQELERHLKEGLR